MRPFFFGDSAAPLLGVMHDPPPALARNHGIVLCPPIGQEHIRAHWALRQVASSLAKAGYHCLRFDWSGVGDSAGELEQATVARWVDDAALAAQELRDVAGVRTISLVGLRLGATIAALATGRVAPAALVLWDPVIDGRAYVAALRRLHVEVEGDPLRYWEPTAHKKSETELLGFELGPTLLADIEATSTSGLAALPRTKIRFLLSSAVAEAAELEETLRRCGHDVSAAKTDLQVSWSSHREVEDLLLAGDAGRRLAALLSEPAPSEARPQ